MHCSNANSVIIYCKNIHDAYRLVSLSQNPLQYKSTQNSSMLQPHLLIHELVHSDDLINTESLIFIILFVVHDKHAEQNLI